MRNRQSYPTAAALAMARAMRRVAAEHGDRELGARGVDLEERATEAISKGLSELPPGRSERPLKP